MTVAEQLGLNLKKARRRAGMSQDAFSRRTGLHRVEISVLERGGRIPRLDTAIRILALAGWKEPRERYEAGKAEHDALAAFAGIFSDGLPRPGACGDA